MEELEVAIAEAQGVSDGLRAEGRTEEADELDKMISKMKQALSDECERQKVDSYPPAIAPPLLLVLSVL